MPSTILISSWTDGLFALTADGRTTHEIASEPVRGLASDPHGRRALAIVGPHTLQQRSPSSDTWTTLAVGASDLSCCLAVPDAIYVGTDDARLLRLTRRASDTATPNSTLQSLQGFDQTAGRDTWFAGSAIVNGQRMGPPLGIRSLAANANHSILFANVHVGGIPRSRDGGTTWEPTIDIQCDVHEVCCHPTDPRILIAAAAVGLCISRDSGSTWTVEQGGLHALHCSAVAFSGDDILVSAAAGPFASEGRIYRRPLHSEGPLVALEGSGMPPWLDRGVDTACIASEGSSLAIADRGGHLYTSEDSGRSWSLRASGLPAPSGVLFC